MLALAACDASVVNGIEPLLGKYHKGTLIALTIHSIIISILN